MGVKIEQGIWTETEGWARFPEGQSGIVRSVLSIEAQTKGVRDVLGDSTPLIGFCSNEKISPFAPGVTFAFHNQTMTITTLSDS